MYSINKIKDQLNLEFLSQAVNNENDGEKNGI